MRKGLSVSPMDQSNKLNQQIQRDNAADLGITKCIWMHVPGQFTQKEKHIKPFDGRHLILK